MKKLIIPFVALFVIAVALVSWRSHNISKVAGAVRIDEGCDVLDGSGAIVPIGPGYSTVTPSGNGHIKCQAAVTNNTGKAVKWNFDNTGLVCNVAGAGGTTEWQDIVSASGNSTLQCHVNPGN